MCRKDCLRCVHFKYAENVPEKYEVIPGVIGFKSKHIPSHCEVNNDAYLEFMEKYGHVPGDVVEENGYEPNCTEFDEIESLKRLRKLREEVDKVCKKIKK